MKSIISTVAAAMIASASFAGAASAEGDYYTGTSKAQVAARADSSVDDIRTSSVEQSHGDSQGARQPIFGQTSRDNR